MSCPEPKPCVCTCDCDPISYGTPLPPPPMPPFATLEPPALSVGLLQQQQPQPYYQTPPPRPVSQYNSGWYSVTGPTSMGLVQLGMSTELKPVAPVDPQRAQSLVQFGTGEGE